ncbi:hypothetical protein [Moorena sp. SIOASIH]|uniref:hypothetical protein n=1 Tax=Moorena sp. SIOASIH TaxID=2607817 RepID=UPI0025FD2169|nr:hypothetical protein [Moorena sp. SIOASIH]
MIYHEGRSGHQKVRLIDGFSDGAKDGTFEHLQARVLAIADQKGLIKWEFGAVDGSFSPWQGRR